ncbi:C-X-C motif chemokine 13 [Pantherophis guttatus]|uniref:C-X-C motif chemokine n=1 Tax=Pantherophis guttatus TaxID=94885 RepID=A0A6P9D4P4_PANGU|nr:C-X-C motif chemokine 13 [Pantherophis guttatus]
MKGLVLILTLVIIANHISQNDGMAFEGHVAHLGRCKCLKQISGFFGLRQVKRIQVIPRGIHCRRTEIIFTLINEWKYCVNPDTPWVISLLKKLTKRYSLAYFYLFVLCLYFYK